MRVPLKSKAEITCFPDITERNQDLENRFTDVGSPTFQKTKLLMTFDSGEFKEDNKTLKYFEGRVALIVDFHKKYVRNLALKVAVSDSEFAFEEK